MAEERRELHSDSPNQLSASIPLIDLHLLSQSDGSSQEEMAKLRSALSSWGLFQAIGHGIPTSFLDEVCSIGRQFFQLPMEEKQRYAKKGTTGFGEGYGRDPIDPEAGVVELSDRIVLLVEPEDQRKFELWPDKPSSFREILQEYTARVKMVAQIVLRAMAKCLELDETHFISQFGEKMIVYGRFSHYPCFRKPDQELGLRFHSDNSLITIILQGGDTEGLELLKDDVWVKVPKKPEVLLIQMGDLMEIVSNGTFKSSVHRVVTHSEKERISTTFFYGLDPENEIGPMEELLKVGKPGLYKDLKVKDYLDFHFKCYTEGKRSIDWAKV